MSETALSETAMLSSLRDIRLPAEAAGGIWADVAVSAGLAGLAALTVAGLVRLISLRLHTPSPVTLRDQLAELEHLPEADQRVGLLHLLKQVAPERYAEIRKTLYRPAAGPDLMALRDEVAGHA